VRKKFGLIGRHVDLDRTIAFAALAGEAKIQRFMDVVLFLAAIKRIPLQRLPEHVRFP